MSHRISLLSTLGFLMLLSLIISACAGVETPVAAPEETEEPATEDTGASDDADEDTEEEEEDTTGAAAGEPEVTDVSIRFSWVPQYQFAGYIVAEVNGYYDEAGLDVTLNGGGPEFLLGVGF